MSTARPIQDCLCKNSKIVFFVKLDKQVIDAGSEFQILGPWWEIVNYAQNLYSFPLHVVENVTRFVDIFLENKGRTITLRSWGSTVLFVLSYQGATGQIRQL